MDYIYFLKSMTKPSYDRSLLGPLLTLLTHLLSTLQVCSLMFDRKWAVRKITNVISSRENDTIHFFLWHILLLVIIAAATIAFAFGWRQTMASSRTLQSISAPFLSYLVCSAHWALCKRHTTLLALSSYPVVCPVCSVQEKRYTSASARGREAKRGDWLAFTSPPSSSLFQCVPMQCRDQPAANTSSGPQTRSAATLITQSVA